MEPTGPAYPLTISHHVTNTQILPLHTWIDKLSDLEWVAKSPPMDPDFLLTETVARQIGSYSDLIVPLTRDLEKSVVYKQSGMGPEALVRMEWGMRMVHEIARWGYPFASVATAEPGRRLEKAVWDFGYGLPAVPRAELLERRYGGPGSRRSALAGADLPGGPADHARAAEL